MKNETIELYFLNFYFFLFGIVFHNLKEGKNGSVVLSIQLYYEKWNFKIEKKKKIIFICFTQNELLLMVNESAKNKFKYVYLCLYMFIN